MTIKLTPKNVILFTSLLTILIVVGNLAMDAYWKIDTIAHLYSSTI